MLKRKPNCGLLKSTKNQNVLVELCTPADGSISNPSILERHVAINNCGMHKFHVYACMMPHSSMDCVRFSDKDLSTIQSEYTSSYIDEKISS